MVYNKWGILVYNIHMWVAPPVFFPTAGKLACEKALSELLIFSEDGESSNRLSLEEKSCSMDL